MLRPLAALVILLPAFPLSLAIAPVPLHLMKPAPLYFPTTVGSKWVYELDGEERVEVVTAVAKKGEDTIVSVGAITKDGRIEPNLTIAASQAGLRVVALGTDKLTRPRWLLKLPCRVTERWDSSISVEGETHVTGWTATTREPEEVDVLAGVFRALKVEHDPKRAGDRGHQVTYWYAPGVGVVKKKIGLNGDYYLLLKSFTPGT